VRRLIIFATVALLGVTPLGVVSVWAQGDVIEPWPGVKITEDEALLVKLNEFLGESGDLRAQLTTGYLVSFENSGDPYDIRAHIPELEAAEFMAVYVSSGEFVLDVMPPTSFIVETVDDRPIAMLNAEDVGDDTHYTLDQPTAPELLNENGESCTELCTVPPRRIAGEESSLKEDRRTAIQLLTGDWVLAPAGGICVWCLLNAYHESGTTGELYVFPLPDGEFSWAQGPSAEATPALQGTLGEDSMVTDLGDSGTTGTLSNVAAWAFFNPAGNCRSP
jgi:hypothetical protein